MQLNFFYNTSVQEHIRAPKTDIIYTIQGLDGTCCIAVQSGMKYGIQSRKLLKVCPYAQQSERHGVYFVDNHYKEYNHQMHLDVVMRFKPKYATTRDMIEERECVKLGIQYYDADQILSWADELAEHCEHVIIIPKSPGYIRLIPDRFIIGYSIPTRYGGSHFPIELITNHRIHLLGGSWKKQLYYLHKMREQICSVDNNYIHHQARHGCFINPEGESFQLNAVGLGYLDNPRISALSLSFGAISRKIRELETGWAT